MKVYMFASSNVLPVPVCAIPTTSLPERITGQASDCMGVGLSNPSSSIALYNCVERFKFYNV